MGCFNVTCCASRTPILRGETCYAVLFKSIDKAHFAEGQSVDLPYILSDSFDGIIKGIYNDYGGLHGHPDLDSAFFISTEAWKVGEKVLATGYNKGWIDRCVGIDGLSEGIERLAVLMASMKDKIEDPAIRADMEKTLAKSNANKVSQYREELRVVVALYSFCQLNHINLFDPSYGNHYGGQEWHLDEKDEWMKLRAARIATLRAQEEV